MSSKTTFSKPFELIPLFQPKVWGRYDLAPFFANPTENDPVGEVWFTFTTNLTKSGQRLGDLIAQNPELLGAAYDPSYPNQCPLLVKLLFTTERLSVQVHPRDDYARQHHESLGKTEAWYVVDSEPGGEVAVGFTEKLTPERMQAAAQSGEIEKLLDWRAVKAGDVIFVPAGTVHAIGAGVTICEIQQNSDITYRLYDYGRPRELHLDHGVKVSELGPHHYHTEPLALSSGRDELVVCDYFRIEHLRIAEAMHFGGRTAHYKLLTCLKGAGEIAGEPFSAGQTWLVPAQADAFNINGPASEWILAYTAATHAEDLAECAL